MKPERTLTDADIAALVQAFDAGKSLQTADAHCRYDIPPEELKEMVRLAKNWNQILENGQKTLWNTVIVLVITGLFTLLGLGAIARIRGG